jgi:DNA polymerase-1
MRKPELYEITPLTRSVLTPAQYDEALGSLADVFTRFNAVMHIVTTPDQLAQALHACLDPIQPYVAIDLETAIYPEFSNWVAGTKAKRTRQGAFHPSAGWIRLIQLCANGRDVYVIDAAAFEPSFLHAQMQTLFASSKRFVAHHAIFEMYHLRGHGYTLSSTFSCTRLTARAQGQIERLSLNDRMQQEFGIELVKGADTGGSNWAAPVLSPLQYRYAAIDALAVFHLFERDRVRLRAMGCGAEYLLYHDAQPATVTARLAGMPIDVHKLDAYILELHTKLQAAMHAVQTVMQGVNVNSGKQLGEWARRTLPAEVCDAWPTTPAGAMKFSDDVLVNYDTLPGIREIVQAKQLGTLHAAALGWRDYVNPATGRIHASLQLAQAATGRFACSAPNLQNISSKSDARAIFAAQPGYKLIGCDYSQIELRLIAVMAPVPLFIETYKNGGDVYIDTARAVFDITQAQWDALTPAEKKTKRSMGKVLCLALNYRAGPATLQRAMMNMAGLSVTMAQAHELTDLYLARTELATWHANVTAAAKSSMKMTSAAGRVRRFDVEGFKQKDLYTHPANTRIQASGADLILDAWKTIDARLAVELPSAELVMTVHDEFIAHAPECEAPQVARILKEEMTASVRRILGDLAAPVIEGIAEPVIGNNWAEVH